MKAKKMNMPRYLTFSGTGSKTIQILTPENSILEAFTKLIFEKIFEKNYNSNRLEIIFNSKNPKEATCKGGILNPNNQSYESIDNIKATLIGTDTTKFADGKIKYSDITSGDLDLIVNETKDFIEFVFNLNNMFSFSKKFGASDVNLDSAKLFCFLDIKKHLKDGIDKKIEEYKQVESKQAEEIKLVECKQPIEETLFFYPLNGIINTLVYNIYNNKG